MRRKHSAQKTRTLRQRREKMRQLSVPSKANVLLPFIKFPLFHTMLVPPEYRERLRAALQHGVAFTTTISWVADSSNECVTDVDWQFEPLLDEMKGELS